MSRQQEADDDEESEEEFQEIAASEDNWECENGGNGGDFEESEDLDASGHSLDPKDDSGSESDHNQQKRPRVKSTCRHYADNRYWVKATEERHTTNSCKPYLRRRSPLTK